MTVSVTGPVVDVHTHVVPNGWPDLAVVTGSDGWPWLRVDSEQAAMIMVGDGEYRPIGAACWSAAERLADMDADGIDRQVVSPTPLFFGYERDAGEAVKVARIFNDLTLECIADGGNRLIPFCQVPLQDPDAACAELDRCLAAGHCADIGAPVFVHPWDMPSGPRHDRWMARWLSGMPAETHLSVLAMILGGVFDRLPLSLRVCFAHGGGSFPYWLGRLDNAWQRRGELVRGHSAHPPSEYTDRFFVDSVVFHHAALRLLVDVALGRVALEVAGDRLGQLVRREQLDLAALAGHGEVRVEHSDLATAEVGHHDGGAAGRDRRR